jgi:hypothetical protein
MPLHKLSDGQDKLWLSAAPLLSGRGYTTQNSTSCPQLRSGHYRLHARAVSHPGQCPFPFRCWLGTPRRRGQGWPRMAKQRHRRERRAAQQAELPNVLLALFFHRLRHDAMTSKDHLYFVCLYVPRRTRSSKFLLSKVPSQGSSTMVLLSLSTQGGAEAGCLSPYR